MTRMSLPLLLEDGSSLDWPDSKYELTVRIAGNQATITHSLAGAPSLQHAIDQGAAKWAAEFRCPKTLMSRIELSSKPKHTIRWQRDELDGDSWIVPGLLAVQELSLGFEDLGSIWKEEGNLVAPRGWWLARGTKRKVHTLAQSLLRFVEGETLDKGRMEIKPERGSGQLRFVVHLAPDIWVDIRSSRTLQVAALVGVCGHFPNIFGKDPLPAEEEPAIAREIRHRLEDADVPVWTDEAYDPALAATVIEPFYPALDHEKQEE